MNDMRAFALDEPQVIKTTDGQADLPRWFAASFALLKGLGAGQIDISLPDGRLFRVVGAAPGPSARIDVLNPGLFGRVAREGELGFCEAYLDGWWDTPDLQTLLDVLLTSSDWVDRSHHPAGRLIAVWHRFNHWLNRNTKQQARRNIAAHYDLGNAFYSRWLDETMTYSSALFSHPTETLEQAQTRKYAAVWNAIGAGEGARLLEIGCGWGGFAEHAAKRGARVTALTISREQHDFARARMQAEGLADRVEIVLRDYRDERGRYDGIASIEMFEAVGERYWPAYFDTVRERLMPGARATIQVITVADDLFPKYRKTPDFIQKYIFPGGMLPSPTALREQIQRARLLQIGSLEFGESYSETLRRWHHAFAAAWSEIAPLGFDERFRRMWTFYLTSCAAAFRTGTADVAQVTMQRPA